MLPEFVTISKLLDAIDAECKALQHKADSGEDVNWLSVDRVQRANMETREALKVLGYSRA